jgi:hypothetical protein
LRLNDALSAINLLLKFWKRGRQDKKKFLEIKRLLEAGDVAGAYKIRRGLGWTMGGFMYELASHYSIIEEERTVEDIEFWLLQDVLMKTLENAYNAVPLDKVPLINPCAEIVHANAVSEYEHGAEDDKKGT